MIEPDAVIVEPALSKRDIKTFIRLPRQLYATLPGYVPPLDLERRAVFDPAAASFFSLGRARYFLARRGGQVVGRVSAQVDPTAIASWGAAIGLFGALDAIDEQPVVDALLNAATDWLRDQGMQRARGPYNLSPTGESGQMISGQVARSMVMMSWHPAYLAARIETAGWAKAMDLLAYELEVGPAAEAALPVPTMRLGEGGLMVRGLRRGKLREDAEIIRRLWNDAWHDNWGFTPLAETDIASMVKELRPVLRRDHLVVVERQGEPLAMALLVPNIYDVVADLGGAPSPAGWVRLGWRIATGRFHSARVMLLGVSSSLRGTPLGQLMPSLIIAELMRRGRRLPFRSVELGWILETNRPMRRLIERLTPTPSKRYRIYEKTL